MAVDPKSIKHNINTTMHAVSFLDTHDLVQFSQTSRIYNKTIHAEKEKRKLVSEQILPHVFNADPKKVAEFLDCPKTNKNLILKKSFYNEGFISKKIQKSLFRKKIISEFISLRLWHGVSPLQAAALCGDNFMVLKLLSYIALDENLRLEAAKQLQEVLDGQVKVTTKSPFASSSKGAYLASFIDLLHAYNNLILAQNNFFNQFPHVGVIGSINPPYPPSWPKKERDELDKLWGIIGECQKRLSRYGLQEFFDTSNVNDPLPKFDTEPNRERLSDAVDLNTLGLSAFKVLARYRDRVVEYGLAALDIRARDAYKDSTAFYQLYTVRKEELVYIIKRLLTPGAAITARPVIKEGSAKP